MKKAAQILKSAENIVVLTGAGISTESGIKDFRSRSGIYTESPEYILSLDYFFEHPKKFYEFAMKNLYHPDALPNDGHKILVKWEKEGRISRIITQNIDALHEKAGSNNVIEFHGTMKTASCVHCGAVYTAEEMKKRMAVSAEYYVCDQCSTSYKEGRYIKPDVVLFGGAGEWFTEEGFESILNTVSQADCLLVLGTSLKVTPFSLFPQARKPGVPLVIVNIGDTPYDNELNTYVIQEPIGQTLHVIDQHLNDENRD
ncbi:NAD-dependent protein deacylase [Mesobacillus zeae]|uniref:protein acetyllysine N-acetyltransferase n=1 Tax=Mesobacillus zeae TaxID=1917180 RepID=A0A398B1Z8_9BACI|nr:NAD-dependent protein deacylase [Mesobacillus zeae]